MSGRWIAVGLCLVGAAAGCNKNKLVDQPVVDTPEPTPHPTSEVPEYLGRDFFALDLDNIYEPAGPFSPEVDAAGAQRRAQRPRAELPAQLGRELPRLDLHRVAGRSGFLRARGGSGQEESEGERETIDPLHGFTGSRTRTARPGK